MVDTARDDPAAVGALQADVRLEAQEAPIFSHRNYLHDLSIPRNCDDDDENV